MKAIPLVLFSVLLLAVIELLCLWTLAKQVSVLWLGLEMAVAGICGLILITHSGLMVWRRTWLSLRDRQLPSPETINGLIVYAAGIGLLIPGIVSDTLAIVLLLPPVRPLITGWTTRRLATFLSRGGVEHLFPPHPE